jgi:hypothetical protein
MGLPTVVKVVRGPQLKSRCPILSEIYTSPELVKRSKSIRGSLLTAEAEAVGVYKESEA